jgi:hypothetical protein
MKAYHVMMFLLLFNLSISAINALSIYPSWGVTPGYDAPTSTGSSAFYSLAGPILSAFVGGVIMASFIRVFTRIPSAAAYVYSIFGGFFIGFTINSMRVLWSLAPDNLAMLIVLGIFGMVTGIVFVAGMMQIVGGGWGGIV